MQDPIEPNKIGGPKYIRPLVLSVAMTEFGELLLLILYGVVLFPEGSMMHKELWTLVFCGIGMGATLGVLVNIFVVDRFTGMKAILMTAALSLLILGIACNLLCLNLDRQFHYFGASSDPYLFSLGSVVGSILGGLTVGAMLFTHKETKFLNRWEPKAA